MSLPLFWFREDMEWTKKYICPLLKRFGNAVENDLLRAMLAVQRGLQEELYGQDVASVEDDCLAVAYVRDMVTAATSELYELLDETSWKPVSFFADSFSLDREGVRRELVDVWMFLMNIMIATRMTADDLFVGFMRKQAEVRIRHGLSNSH